MVRWPHNPIRLFLTATSCSITASNKQISSGGFSLVYLAHDENGLPVRSRSICQRLVLRESGALVQASSAEKPECVPLWNEMLFRGRLALARISHPNVVRVTNFFRANENGLPGDAGTSVAGRCRITSCIARKRSVKNSSGAFSPNCSAACARCMPTRYCTSISSRRISTSVLTAPPVAGFWRGTADADSGEIQSQSDVHAGFRRAGAIRSRSRCARPWTDIYGVGASMFACLAGFAPQRPTCVWNRTSRSRQKTLSGQYSSICLNSSTGA